MCGVFVRDCDCVRDVCERCERCVCEVCLGGGI